MTALTFDFDEFCGRSDCDTTELMRVLGAVRNGAWCAGGAIRRTLIKQPLDSDFDFFFRSAEEMAEWEKKLPSTLALVRETEHHKHWKGPVEGSAIPVEIQAIRFRYYDNACRCNRQLRLHDNAVCLDRRTRWLQLHLPCGI
jgi:hypothetical protein